jgi:hypothetical protein
LEDNALPLHTQLPPLLDLVRRSIGPVDLQLPVDVHAPHVVRRNRAVRERNNGET